MGEMTDIKLAALINATITETLTRISRRDDQNSKHAWAAYFHLLEIDSSSRLGEMTLTTPFRVLKKKLRGDNMNQEEWEAQIEKECECCGYKTSDCREHKIPDTFEQVGAVMLCRICAGSYVSDTLRYPKQFSGAERKILLSIAYIGNMILDEM